MSKKSIILFGMIIGSLAGGYIPVMLGADGISFISLIGSGAGSLIGIWIAFKITQ